LKYNGPPTGRQRVDDGKTTGPWEWAALLRLGRGIPTPRFSQKSAERIDDKGVVECTWAKERTKSAEAIEKKEVHFCVSYARKTKRRKVEARVEDGSS
jgi:hypothetical protein